MSVTGSTVTIAWSPVAGAAGYQLFVSTSPGGAPLHSQAFGAGQTSVTYPGVPAGTYYARVRVANACGAQATSADATIAVAKKRIRKVFGNIHEVTQMPDLIQVQRESYEQFLRSDPSIGYVSGLEKTLRSVFPIRDFAGTAEALRLSLANAGVATSSTVRRAWNDSHGDPVHHLLDPGTGRPLRGPVQATVIAGTAAWAEVYTKLVMMRGVAAFDTLQSIGLGGRVVLTDGTTHCNDVWHSMELQCTRN